MVHIHGFNYSTIRHLLLQYHLCGKTDMRKFKQLDVKQAIKYLKQMGVTSQRIQRMLDNLQPAEAEEDNCQNVLREEPSLRDKMKAKKNDDQEDTYVST